MTIPRSTHPVAVPGSQVRVALGPGNVDRLGAIGVAEGASRVLLVSDAHLVAAGHVERGVRALRGAGIHVELFTDVGENPTTEHVAAGVAFAREKGVDFIVGLGGGSAMDCAKGINFILTNGGRMQDYWGIEKAATPLLPMIAVPTTAGTGSDAQSFALITDPDTHQKMACGAASALPRVSILDPELTATQPPRVAAATGIDAVAHAVETAATTRRNATSIEFSRAAWAMLDDAFPAAMRSLSDADARERMLLGAHLAGAAIQNSMLGAAHALANALTAVYGTVHGVAVGLVLPHVVRFNTSAGENPYDAIDRDAERLARRLEDLLNAGALPTRLADLGVTPDRVPELAGIAAKQWTATFNPRRVGEAELGEMLRSAL